MKFWIAVTALGVIVAGSRVKRIVRVSRRSWRGLMSVLAISIVWSVALVCEPSPVSEVPPAGHRRPVPWEHVAVPRHRRRPHASR